MFECFGVLILVEDLLVLVEDFGVLILILKLSLKHSFHPHFFFQKPATAKVSWTKNDSNGWLPLFFLSGQVQTTVAAAKPLVVSWSFPSQSCSAVLHRRDFWVVSQKGVVKT